MAKDENVFIHEATPTWSGFIYQGEVAIYLAVCKICELIYKYEKANKKIASYNMILQSGNL